jgi:hypothetical protein
MCRAGHRARPPLEHHGPSRHGKKLILINLSFNAFTGSIPEEFAELEAVMNFPWKGTNYQAIFQIR